MDTNETLKRPWWQKKRWWAAAALLLVVSYPLSLPPIFYLAVRGWIPWEVHTALLPSGRWLAENPVLRALGYERYGLWWVELAIPEFKKQRLEFEPDPAVNRTHWTPPDDGINRTEWKPPN